jgi:hypothetical protein
MKLPQVNDPLRKLQGFLLIDVRLSRHRHSTPATSSALTDTGSQVLERARLIVMSLRDH